MPLRKYDPYEDINQVMKLDVNPYLRQILDAVREGTMPVSYGPYLKGRAGTWKDYIKKSGMERAPNKLVLEIGCHLGVVMRQMAQDFPDCGFIGMDITFKRVMKTLHGALQDGSRNVATVYCNASGIDKIFAEKELDGVVIFFPDPWCKKEKQMKNRLINDIFAHSLYSRVASGGFVWLKTDHLPYFNQSDSSFLNAGFIGSQDKVWINIKKYESSFEAKFKREGLPTYEKFYVKTVT